MADSPSLLQELQAENRVLRQRIAELEELQRDREAPTGEQPIDTAMYRQALDAIPDLVFIKDSASRLVYANQAFCDYYGCSLDELLGTVESSPHKPSEVQAYLRDDAQVLATGQTLVIAQQAMTARDDSVRLFHTIKSPIRDAKGNVVQVVSIAHDITEHKQAQEALVVSDQRFRLLVDNLPIVFFLRSAEGQLLYISPTYEKIWGRSLAELGENPRAWIDAIHPDDQQDAINGFRQMNEIELELEYRIVRPDGDIRWISASSMPMRNDEGQTEQIAGFAADITERKHMLLQLQQSEARFREMAENIGEVVWMVNYPDYDLAYLSPSFEQVWGRSCASLYAREISFLDAIHPDDLQRVTAKLAKQAEGSYNEEYRIIRPDGSVVWIRDRAFPIHDDQGNVTRVVGIASNITEQKQAIAEQQRLQESMIQLQAATLAELSTPLIPISDRVMVLPLIGALDTQRTQQVLTTLLEGVAEQQAQVVIVDITGIRVVDTQVANTLIQAARAVRLLGARVMLTGIRPEVAHTLISLGVDLSDLDTAGTLQSGIANVLS